MKHFAYLLGVLVASVCLANVIRVPNQYSSIQDAVDMALPNDTIYVSPGVYTSNSDFSVVHIYEHQLTIIGGGSFGDTKIIGTMNGSHGVSVNVSGCVIENLDISAHNNALNVNMDCVVKKCLLYGGTMAVDNGFSEEVVEIIGSILVNGITVSNSSLLSLDRCTVVRGNIRTTNDAEINISNSILLDLQYIGNLESLSSSYTCQFPVAISSGTGNLFSDPYMQTGEYNLTPLSPCIDAGDPSSPLDPDGTRADIGAYYFCQGEGIALPDIVRTSTEPGYPEPITATLQSTCDPVVIDSARTETGLFTLDSYPSQVAGEFQSGDFQLTFHPSVQGVFTDTLHIWADTDPPHQKIPLVGESGPIPAPVTDLSINILPDLSAQLTWSRVTQTIYGNPVTPDYYLIFYNEQDPADEADWYYLTPVAAPGYTHQLVARFRDLMNYRVIAWKGIDPALLGLTPGVDFPTFLQVSKDMRR